MAGFVLRRLAIAVVLMWLVSVITFVLYLRVPEEPAAFLVAVQHASPAQIARARHALGVDRPVTTQYAKVVWRGLHGDLGVSWATVNFFNGRTVGRPVGPMVWHAAEVTASLVVGGLALMLVVAVSSASWLRRARGRGSTARPSASGSPRSRPTRSSSACCCSCSSATGGSSRRRAGTARCTRRLRDRSGASSSASSRGPRRAAAREWVTHLILPWITFALFFVALYMRVVRARMIDVLEEPFIRTERAKGASEARVVRAHALRNGISPVVTMIGMDAGMAIGIAMYVETVFALPSLGRTTILALGGQNGIDLPVLLGVTLLAAAAVILLNLLADLALFAIDPRISRGRGCGAPRTLGAAV